MSVTRTWLERYIQARLHVRKKAPLESIDLGLETWSCSLLAPSPVLLEDSVTLLGKTVSSAMRVLLRLPQMNPS